MVLSGGGARGLAHAGVLKALEELNISVTAISGVSAGAVVGSLYCAGVSPENIKRILKNPDYFSLNGFSINRNGFYSLQPLREILKDTIPVTRFELLQRRMFVTATDICNKKKVVFSEGDLIEPIIASSSFPVIFEGIKWQGITLLDGGILDNLPTTPLLNECDVIIGCYVNKVEVITDDDSLGKLQILERTIKLLMANTVYQHAKECDLLLEPPGLANFDMFSIKKIDEIYRIGYEFALQHADQLRSITV